MLSLRTVSGNCVGKGCVCSSFDGFCKRPCYVAHITSEESEVVMKNAVTSFVPRFSLISAIITYDL